MRCPPPGVLVRDARGDCDRGVEGNGQDDPWDDDPGGRQPNRPWLTVYWMARSIATNGTAPRLIEMTSHCDRCVGGRRDTAIRPCAAASRAHQDGAGAPAPVAVLACDEGVFSLCLSTS